MFKATVITLNLIALVAIKLFFGGDISVEQKLPESIKAGETFTIEITINKGDQEGFAKWQQKLPDGFIATAGSTSGATFSFKNQDVKLIWMALPKEETITATYEIMVDPSIAGDFSFGGKFSFIEENERKDVSAEVASITVINENNALTENSNEDNQSETDINEESSANNESLANESGNNEIVESEQTEEVSSEDENKATAENQERKSEKDKNAKVVTNEDGIKITRTIEHIENGEYVVNLEIEKGDFNSFGKVEEYLPEGFIATTDQNAKGMFSFKNNVVKILWMALPKNELIQVSYFMKSESDLEEKTSVHGMFSYLKVDESIQLEMKPSKFINYYKEPASDELANEESKSENEVAEVIKENTSSEVTENTQTESTEKESNKVVETETSKSNEEMINNIVDIPSPETDVRYKVQIAAGKKEVKQSYFVQRHKITENVSIEYHNDWYKYTIGSFDVYKSARDRRNEIWAADNKINDAFVTAYNSGERISVQEALMISKQQWYK